MSKNTGVIILAGGQSRRMGTEKALLKFEKDGLTLLEMVVEAARPVASAGIVLVTNQPEKYEFLKPSLSVVVDNQPGGGPLAGLEAGIEALTAQQYLLLACDMPFVRTELLKGLVEWEEEGKSRDALVPLNPEGLPEPLCALYNARVLAVVKEHLGEHRYKMSDFLASIVTRYLVGIELEQYDPALRSFLNFNTPADFERYKAVFSK
ncbi:molybdenum cofactor guanylyltransferase [Candidatus Chlorohelix sp.]|uniref:molybdenum cofactor guanylyltransferase n=1 Tax=Candidatus Chlorohelix sp. TaxID=3139201 RepID=UPI00306FCE57